MNSGDKYTFETFYFPKKIVFVTKKVNPKLIAELCVCG